MRRFVLVSLFRKVCRSLRHLVSRIVLSLSVSVLSEGETALVRLSFFFVLSSGLSRFVNSFREEDTEGTEPLVFV